MPQQYIVTLGISGYLPDYQSELMDSYEEARELMLNMVEDEQFALGEEIKSVDLSTWIAEFRYAGNKLNRVIEICEVEEE